MISENNQHSKKIHRSKGNWEPSTENPFPEKLEGTIQPQFLADNISTYLAPTIQEKYPKKDPWSHAQGFSDPKVFDTDILESKFDGYFNKSLNPIPFTLLRANHTSFQQNETFFTTNLPAKEITSMQAHRVIRDNFPSQSKPNKTIPLLELPQDTISKEDLLRDLDAKFDPSHSEISHRHTLRLSDAKTLTGFSTGISGSESTPSNSTNQQKKFKIPNTIDLIANDSVIQYSDTDFKESEMKNVVVEENEMDLEDFIKPQSDLEKELANFNPITEPCGIDNDTIEFLIEQEKVYSTDPRYLKTKQPYLTWLMRAILVDWMFEVCMEFTLKRDTFHFALNYVDRFLSIHPNVQKQELQLIGVAALFIAAKTEEIFNFGVIDFAKSCDGAYTVDQIIQIETIILRTLRWNLVPPTLNTWAQWYLSQWDLYIEKSPYALSHPLILSLGKEAIIQFRQPNEDSYLLFREIMQYLDCITLDVEHLQYNKRTLVASLIYLIVGKSYKQFGLKQIAEEFPSSSMFLLNKQNLYNNFFSNFLEFIVGFQMEELLPSVQYVAPFFKLPLVFELPRVVQLKGASMPDVN